MRALALLLPLVAVVGLRLNAHDARDLRGSPSAHAGDEPGAPILSVSPSMPRAGSAPATRSVDSPEPVHLVLARRGAAGNVDAVLELARLLEACTEREETRGVMGIFVRDWSEAPACASAEQCAALERIYDEYEISLQQSRAAASDCSAVGRAWRDTRGRWLRRAAEMGDTEAMACYALAGAELAPPPSNESWAAWMDRWRADAPGMAWRSWRRGDLRGALALARIYAPTTYRGDASDLAEPDVRLEYRFSLLLARAFDLDPEDSEIAQAAAQGAGSLTPAEVAQEYAWVEAHLAGNASTRARHGRTPHRCWEHFALFEPRQARP